MIFGSCSIIGTRKYNEDFHFYHHLDRENLYLIGVFDGHGGAEASDFAYRNFI